MNIAEWEFYALCSRLKTERTKRRLRHKDLEKQLIRKYKRLRQVYKEQNNLGYIDLIPPVQKGWKRFFVLREDVSKSEDAQFFQQLLDKINTTQYSFCKDFKVQQKQKGRKVYVESEQPFPVIELYELKKLKLTEKERSYFYYERRYRENWDAWRFVLVFTEPWKFALKVKPHMITRLRIIDPLLMKEEMEIKKHLIKNNLYSKMQKIVHGDVNYRSDRKGHDKMKYRSLLKKEPISNLLEIELNNKN